MGSTPTITHRVLKECYIVLKANISLEVIDELWTKDCISYEDKNNIKTANCSDTEKRQRLVDILITKDKRALEVLIQILIDDGTQTHLSQLLQESAAKYLDRQNQLEEQQKCDEEVEEPTSETMQLCEDLPDYTHNKRMALNYVKRGNYEEAIQSLTEGNEDNANEFWKTIMEFFSQIKHTEKNRELNEFIIRLIDQLTGPFDFNELAEEQYAPVLQLLKFKADALHDLMQYEEEGQERMSIYEISKMRFGELDFKTLKSKRNLALALVNGEKYDEAFSLLTEGDEEEVTAPEYCDMFEIFMYQVRDIEKLAELNEFIIRLVDGRTNSFDLSDLKDDEPVYLYEMLEYKADAHGKLENYEEEEQVRKEILQICENWKEGTDTWTLKAKKNLARCLIHNASYDEALSLLTEGDETREASYWKMVTEFLYQTKPTEPNPELSEFSINLIDHLIAHFDLNELHEKDCAYVSEMLEYKADALGNLENCEEETQVRKTIFEICNASYGDSHVKTLKAKKTFSQHLMKNGNYDEAFSFLNGGDITSD